MDVLIKIYDEAEDKWHSVGREWIIQDLLFAGKKAKVRITYGEAKRIVDELMRRFDCLKKFSIRHAIAETYRKRNWGTLSYKKILVELEKEGDTRIIKISRSHLKPLFYDYLSSPNVGLYLRDCTRLDKQSLWKIADAYLSETRKIKIIYEGEEYDFDVGTLRGRLLDAGSEVFGTKKTKFRYREAHAIASHVLKALKSIPLSVLENNIEDELRSLPPKESKLEFEWWGPKFKAKYDDGETVWVESKHLRPFVCWMLKNRWKDINELLKEKNLNTFAKLEFERVARAYRVRHYLDKLCPRLTKIIKKNPVVVLLSGTSAVGKTTLALRLGGLLEVNDVFSADHAAIIIKNQAKGDLKELLKEYTYKTHLKLSEIYGRDVPVAEGYMTHVRPVIEGIVPLLNKIVDKDRRSVVSDGIFYVPQNLLENFEKTRKDWGGFRERLFLFLLTAEEAQIRGRSIQRPRSEEIKKYIKEVMETQDFLKERFAECAQVWSKEDKHYFHHIANLESKGRSLQILSLAIIHSMLQGLDPDYIKVLKADPEMGYFLYFHLSKYFNSLI